MKPNNTPPPTTEDSREGLHTQGEWSVSKNIPEQNQDGQYGIDIDCYETHLLALATVWADSLEDKEAKANAAIIVRAVNDRQAMIDSLKMAANNMAECIENWELPEEAASFLHGEIDAINEILKTKNHVFKLNNERQKLLDSNRELKEALEDAREVMLSFKDAPDWDAEKEDSYRKVVTLIK